MIVILGAGIAGISAAYHLALRGRKSDIYEKRSRWGGLCDNFEIDGFRFDTFVHLSFSKNEYVKNLFAKSSPYKVHKPIPYNFYHGHWLRHPAQNNIYSLPTEEKIKIIKGFVNRKNVDDNFVPDNYDQWLELTYGEYFHENFSKIYTEKYWTLPADKMSVDWIKNRIHQPSIDEILLGAFEDNTTNYYYADEMRYPVTGGYKSFLKGMVVNLDIKLNREVMLIDIKKKQVCFTDGSSVYYEHLISSLPLPVIISLIKEIPNDILHASQELSYTSGQLVSLGLMFADIPKHLWYYIYDKDIIPSRVYSPSIKSEDNVPAGGSSLQFESYFSKYLPKKLNNDDLLEHVVNKSAEFGWIDKNSLKIADCRDVEFANVIFDLKRRKNLALVKDYIEKANISLIGRFGEWEYFWSDQSLLSGKSAADKVLLN